MWSFKIFVAIALISIGCQSVKSQPVIKPVSDADWEVVLQAINNPNSVTLPVLQHAIFRILASFVPPFSPRPRPAPAPAPVAPNPAPAPSPAPIPIIVPTVPAPSPRPTGPQISPELLLQLLSSNPNLFRALQTEPHALGAIARVSHPEVGLINRVPARSVATISAPPHIHINHHHGDDCGCKKKGQKSLADFMVNVPCPKTTEKPPRKVVVKVPCPTTEKPCNCQCCPCNPCKKNKKPKKLSCSSESKESMEVKTYIPKKHNEVRHPYQIHRVHVENGSEEKAKRVYTSNSSEETKPRPGKKHSQWHSHKTFAHYQIHKHPHLNSDSNE